MTTRQERYWAKVDRRGPDQCWGWTAFRNPCGYGVFRGDNGEQLAHRYGYRLAYGDIPAEGQVLHRCDNPPCQNPSHLFLGDPAANAADKVAKGRQARVPQPGEKNAQATLREADVLEIRRCYLAGEDQESLARRFGTLQHNVSRIVTGKRWGHLPVVLVDGNQRRRRGTDHPHSKLSDEQVAEIQRAYNAGEAPQAGLAERFGVSQQMISRVVRGLYLTNRL